MVIGGGERGPMLSTVVYCIAFFESFSKENDGPESF
jgi:hypothetical protein